MINIIKDSKNIPIAVVVIETGTCVALRYVKSVKTIPIGRYIQVILSYYYSNSNESFQVFTREDAYSIVTAVAFKISKSTEALDTYDLLVANKVIEDAMLMRVGPVYAADTEYTVNEALSSDDNMDDEDTVDEFNY